MSYLWKFREDIPPFRLNQEKSFDWLSANYADWTELSADRLKALLQRVGAKPPEVENRFHYLPDFQGTPRLFQKLQSPPLAERMAFYTEATDQIFSRLLEDEEGFGHLFHVSCTGYVSPSGAQRWATQRKNQSPLMVSHLYHMGCYAALPALRHAHFACQGSSEAVEVCHTELCTLHMNPRNHELENMVIHTLFADGACAYRVQKDRPQNQPSLQYLSSHEELLPNSESAMSWDLGGHGFQMTLSKDVPKIVGQALPEILEKWLRDQSLLKDPSLIWAVHPGGPKILDQVQSTFELQDSQLVHSRKILREHGNMSSATLPHVWSSLLRDQNITTGTKVVTMAFGPGLTVSLALLEVQR